MPNNHNRRARHAVRTPEKYYDENKNCLLCEHCQYIGDGAYFCDEHNEIVLEDFVEPTDSYMQCGGKDFVNEVEGNG